MKLFLAYKIIAAVMAVVVGTTAAGGGVVFAANDSLPGNALYPLKLFVEDARLSLTADPAARAGLNLSFAAERAEEMLQLAAQGEPVPEDTIARMVRHTERVMAQIARAEQEDVPGLLERVTETTRAQERALEQVRALAPEEAQSALRWALEATRRVYEDARTGLQDPQRFQEEYRHRYGGTPGPHGEASPSHTLTPPCEDCTPVQERHQEREQNQDQTVTPVGTQQQERERERNQDMTSTPGPDQGQNREQEQNQNQAVAPIGTQEQERHRERNQEMTHTPEPPGACQTCTPEPDQDRTREREQERTHPTEPTSTSGPADAPRPASTPRPTQTPNQGPPPTHTPGATETPKHGGP